MIINKKSSPEVNEIIFSNEAPKPIGPYSQAVVWGKLIFLSGQIGIDPKTNEMVDGGLEAETRQILENIKAILKEAGSNLQKVIKVNIYLRNMNDFSVVNQIYGEYFKENPPARTTIGGLSLPKSALIEMDVVAYRD